MDLLRRFHQQAQRFAEFLELLARHLAADSGALLAPLAGGREGAVGHRQGALIAIVRTSAELAAVEQVAQK